MDAEIAAWPLASEEAFKLGLTELDPLMAGPMKAAWRAIFRFPINKWMFISLL